MSKNDTVKTSIQNDMYVEKRMLATLYNQPEFLKDVRIEDSLFSSFSTKNLYQALINLNNRGIPFSKESVYQEFSVLDLDADTYVVDAITGPDHESVTTIDDIIIQLEDAKKRRKAVQSLKKAVKELESTTRLDDTSKILDNIFEAEEAITSKNNDDIKRLLTFEDWFDLYEKEGFPQRLRGKQYTFRHFIFDTLVPGGPVPGEVGVLASASGSGKTTIATDLANALIEFNIPLIYCLLEMSAVSILDRLLSNRLGIPYKDITNPGENFDAIQVQIEQEKKELINNKNFRVCEDPEMSINDLSKHIKKFQADIGQKYCIVIIDLISMMPDFTKSMSGANFAQGIEVAINRLSAVAKTLGVHILGVLQLGKSSEPERAINDIKDIMNYRPTKAQIKNAHAWTERSRYVLTTFRPKYYAEASLPEEIVDEMQDIMDISVVKQNNSELKTVQALFIGETFSIEPLETKFEYD